MNVIPSIVPLVNVTSVVYFIVSNVKQKKKEWPFYMHQSKSKFVAHHFLMVIKFVSHYLSTLSYIVYLIEGQIGDFWEEKIVVGARVIHSSLKRMN